MGNTSAVRRATGRDRGEWFVALDEWGAPGCSYREIAEWLTGEHDVSRWWRRSSSLSTSRSEGYDLPACVQTALSR